MQGSFSISLSLLGWQLFRGFLLILPFPPSDNEERKTEMLKKFHHFQHLAELYHAYHFIHKCTVRYLHSYNSLFDPQAFLS